MSSISMNKHELNGNNNFSQIFNKSFLNVELLKLFPDSPKKIHIM